MWMPHLPGQHYDVRLTAPDGYRTQRSYSIASSPPDEGRIELSIDRLEDGEVSPYLQDVAVEGDQVAVQGPFTSYFVWRGESPVLLVGGGSGVVPLMAMLRHRRCTMPELPMRLVYSVRSAEDACWSSKEAVGTGRRARRGVPCLSVVNDVVAGRDVRVDRRRGRARLERRNQEFESHVVGVV